MKIKRPLFTISLSILVVINAINTMPGSIVYASLALFALFTVFHRITKNKYTAQMLLFLISALIGVLYINYYSIQLEARISNLENMDNMVLSGYVAAQGNSASASCYTIKAETVNGEKINNFKVTVYSADYFSTGERVELHGKFKGFTRKSNYIYNYANGINGYFYRDNIVVLKNNRLINSFFTDLRTNLTDRARRIFAYDTVPVAVAMGIGDKTLLDKSFVNAFAFTGTMHALVVSGLHVGFIAAVINMLLKYIPVKKKLKNIVVIVLVYIFMGIAGFTPSVTRAGILLIAAYAGRNLLVEFDNYTVLAVIILITVFINPYSANNASLLLSYSAYLGVIQAANISKAKKYSYFKSTLLLTTFAVIYTSPVMAMLGMDMTLLSPIFNLLLAYPVMIVCVLSFFLPVFSFIPILGNIVVLALAPVNELFIRILSSFAHFAENNFAFAMINMGADEIKVLVFAVIIAAAIAYVQIESINLRRIFVIVIPIVALLCYNILNRDIVTVQVFDGSSQPSYIISYKDEDYLVVTENIGQKRFKNVLNKMKISSFSEIIFCGKKEADTDFYSQYSDSIKVLSASDKYENDMISISADIQNRKYGYVFDISDVRFGFSHNKADMSEYDLDFYFFGADAPKAVESDNYFYFYPVIKGNIALTQEKQAKELYDVLSVKIKLSTGRYYIVEDVKNFGSRL